MFSFLVNFLFFVCVCHVMSCQPVTQVMMNVVGRSDSIRFAHSS